MRDYLNKKFAGPGIRRIRIPDPGVKKPPIRIWNTEPPPGVQVESKRSISILLGYWDLKKDSGKQKVNLSFFTERYGTGTGRWISYKAVFRLAFIFKKLILNTPEGKQQFCTVLVKKIEPGLDTIL
jgi:hypothetical protein